MLRTKIVDLPGWLSEQRDAAATLATAARTQNQRRYHQGRVEAFDVAFKATSDYLNSDDPG